MTPDDYLNLITNMHHRLIHDPTTNLALTVAWLDPLTVLSDLDSLADQDLSEYYYAGDEFGAALIVARDCFPGIYAEAISQIRAGESDLSAVSHICSAISEQTGLPVDDYELPYAFAFGIPLPYYGFDRNDPDFVEHHPLEAHLLCLLGATLDESDPYTTVNVPDDLWDIAHLLQWSLWPTKDDATHRDIMWAIAYCCSNSGNSSVDYNLDLACEWEPLSWTQDDLEFAMLIAEEAAEIMTYALQGLEIIQSNPDIQSILKRKVAEATPTIKRIQQKGLRLRDCINREEPNPFGLQWDDLYRCPDGDPPTDPELLQLRVDAA